MLVVSLTHIEGTASAGADLLLFDSRGLPPQITQPLPSVLDPGSAILRAARPSDMFPLLVRPSVLHHYRILRETPGHDPLKGPLSTAPYHKATV